VRLGGRDFSFFVNLLMLTGRLYTLNVYDRCWGGGGGGGSRIETLIAPSAGGVSFMA
jgi:ABC-type protease/lipase transport system fused ATPase/permease subunit